MRTFIATSATAITLLLGGAGVAHATAPVTPAPAATSSVTTLADDNDITNNDDHGYKTGLWGLAGLLGLIGLAGLKRRNAPDAARYPAAPGAVPGGQVGPRA